ncbi:MAG: acyl-ACP--UDP-N-acetylglucosamine O-acyltransferase [Nitrospirae bacterium]|nr:acyl-ACP--UDP-N-acetylglucosamine O-acyltransferase [Nitrospirota bacterium]
MHPTAIIDPGARLADDVTVGPFAVIDDKVTIGRGTKVGAHAVIRPFVEIGEDNEIYQFASIGDLPQDLKFGGEESRLVIGDRNRIREFCTLNRGTKGGGGVTGIGSDCFLMAYAHVAHDCHLEDNVIIANAVQMGGHVHIGEYAIVGGLTAVHQFVRIGAHCMIGGASAVSQDIPPYVIAAGNRTELHGLNLIGLKRRGFPDESLSALKSAYRLLFRSGLTIKEAVERVKAEVVQAPEVVNLLGFIASSERGVCR